MSAENEREGEADGRTENKIAQVLLDSKYGDSPYVLARAILQAINFAAHQSAYDELAKRCNQLEHLVGSIAELLRKDMTNE